MDSDFRRLSSACRFHQSLFTSHLSPGNRGSVSADLYCYARAAENSHRQGAEICPSRQARDFEAVTGLTMREYRASGNRTAAISDGCYAARVFGINVECLDATTPFVALVKIKIEKEHMHVN